MLEQILVVVAVAAVLAVSLALWLRRLRRAPVPTTETGSSGAASAAGAAATGGTGGPKPADAGPASDPEPPARPVVRRRSRYGPDLRLPSLVELRAQVISVTADAERILRGGGGEEPGALPGEELRQHLIELGRSAPLLSGEPLQALGEVLRGLAGWDQARGAGQERPARQHLERASGQLRRLDEHLDARIRELRAEAASGSAGGAATAAGASQAGT